MHHQHHHQLKQRTTKRFCVFAHLFHFTAISIWAYLYLPLTLNDCPSLSPSPFMILYTYILYYIQFSRHIPPVSISVGDGVWASFYYIIITIIIITIVINILFLAYHSLYITLALLCHLYVIVACMLYCLPHTRSHLAIHSVEMFKQNSHPISISHPLV